MANSVSNFKDRKYFLSFICLLMMLMSAVYIALDYLADAQSMAVYHSIAFSTSLISFYLNKKNFYLPAYLLVLLGVCVTIYTFSSSGFQGAYLLYLPVVNAVYLFLEYQYQRYSIVFSILVLALFLFGEYYPIQYTNPDVMPSWYSIHVKSINFILALLSIIIVVQYLVKARYYSEMQLKLANEKLEHNKEMLETANKITKSGVWEYDIKSETIYVSDEIKVLLGISGEEKEDVSVDDFLGKLHPDDLEVYNGEIKRALKQGNYFFKEIRIRDYNNNYRWYSQVGQVDLDKNVITGKIRDIHDKKINDEVVLQETITLKEEKGSLDSILHSTTHDIKGPLASIKGLINIANKTDDAQEIKSYMNIINGQVLFLDGFINDMLNMSFNANAKVSKQNINLLDLTNSVLDSIKFVPEYSDIKYILNIDSELVIEADERRLKIILNNLISNASKYNSAAKNSFVDITVSHLANEVGITISDNGIGIPKNQLDKIFNLFHRATEEKKGSGVGLYIVKEATLKLGGSINVASTLGEHTVFEIKLPI